MTGCDVHRIINYRIHSIETARHYYMELGLGAISNLDIRSPPCCFIIGSGDYIWIGGDSE